MTERKAKLYEALTNAKDNKETKEILTLNKISLKINNIEITDDNVEALKKIAIENITVQKAPRGAWAKREDEKMRLREEA